MRMSRTLQAHQLLDELCLRNIGADAVKTLQLGVEVIARGEHDGMRTMAVLDEEIAVGKKHMHRHEIVITHRKNIQEKLGIKSVSSLTIYAVMHGYVDINRI